MMDKLKAVERLTELRAKVRRNAEGYAQANADAKVAECNAQADALTVAIAALTPAAGVVEIRIGQTRHYGGED